MLYGELGRYPITINIKTRLINFWNRIICGNHKKISYQIYKFILNDSNHEYKWLNCVKSIFNETGNGIMWITQNYNMVKNIHKVIQHDLIDQFKQEWTRQLQLSQKGRNFCIYKTELKFEPYLTLLPQSLAINMFLFRTANHRLPVETGRWTGTPYAERKCKQCSLNAIGDEMHYLFSCPKFSRNRQNSLSGMHVINNTFSFDKLLNAIDRTLLVKLSQFMFSIRNEING